MVYKIDLLNSICTDNYNGTGGHVQNITALNEWCVLAGGTGAHRFEISAYNELSTLYGGTGGYKYDIDALNEICVLSGGTGGHRFAVDALVELGALLNQIPAKNLATMWLDGTILENDGSYYFVDKIAGNNVLINNYDFPDNWVKGFPYKSAATINIFGQTGVPVISLFQNFDYANQYFCKHIAQVVDENGVETSEAYVIDIVAYSEALTGDVLTEANTYYGTPVEDATAKWATASGSDVNAGTKLLPDKTWQHSMDSENTGKQIYWTSQEFTYATLYTYLNNNVTAIGFCKLTSTNNANALLLQNAAMAKFEGLVINVSVAGGRVYVNQTLNLVFKRNYLIGNGSGVTSFIKEVINNIFTGIYGNSSYCVDISSGVTNKLVSGNLFKGSGQLADINTSAANVIITHNKFIGLIRADGGRNINIATTVANVLIKSNHFKNLQTGGLVNLWIDGDKTSTADIEICFNQFYSTLQDYKNIEVLENQTKIPYIHDNYFEKTFNGNVRVISYHAGNVHIKNNLIKCTGIGSGGDDLDGDIQNGEVGALVFLDHTIENNKIISNKETENHIISGFESSTDGNDHITVKVFNNFVKGYGTFNASYAAANGVYVGYQKNAEIKHNKFEGIKTGVIIKGGTNTEKGVTYNIIKDCHISINPAACINVLWANNTIVSKYDAAYGILCETGTSGNLFKNNIIILNGAGTCYGARDISLNANTFDYNIYYCPNGTLKFRVNATDYTFAEWQALGYDEHSIVLTEAQYNALMNADYTLKSGSVAVGSGVALDAAYNDGLAASTNWGNDSQTPVVVTKQQGENWDIGAYIH